MKRIPLTVAVFAVFSAHAAPPCQQRVDALKALAARLQPELGSWSRGPVMVTLDARRSPKAAAQGQSDWKKKGVRLNAALDDAIEPDLEPGLARDLLELAAQTKVELCVPQNAPVAQKLSRDADAEVLAPVLAELASARAEDRATIVASVIQDATWRCSGVPDAFAAVAYVAPADRLALVAKSVAEGLEECGCPARETERIYALLTLMADVWSDHVECAPLVVGGPGAKPVKLAGPVMDLVKALRAAGPAGVTLPQALPPKPAPPPKKP